MDIFDFAMKMEMDGKRFYESKAAEASLPALKEILMTLAEEELTHYNFFAKLKKGETGVAIAQLSSGSATLKKVSNIFVRMSESASPPSFGENELSVWTEALRIEETAEKFYREKATAEPDKEKSRLLGLIADEERNHIHMIDGVLTYLKHPESFADSAQFKNFRSLEGM